MKKFRAPLTAEEQKELHRLAGLDFSHYTEADVREEFLVELLKLLGYRKELDYSVSREESFNLNPLFLSVGSKRIKLDYLCTLRKQYFWIIDAKEGRTTSGKPQPIAQKDIEQAHFYSLHAEINCRYFVVSNGWYTNLYDRDNLGEQLTPVLSILHTELPSRFIELDAVIGATQILPMLKEKLLHQIDRIFSAEIRVERLDEFIGAVKEKAAQNRAKVEKAARDSYKEEGIGSTLTQILETEDIANLVYSLLQNQRRRYEMDFVSGKLVERIIANKTNPQFGEYFFFRNLLLQNPYPVNYWYYPSVLHFLFALRKAGVKNVAFGQRGTDELLSGWIDFCLFHLSSNKIMRYLWACERLYAKILKQSMIMLPVFRTEIQKLLDKGLYYLPEEKLAPLGPNQASMMINIIEASLSHFRATFINDFYDEEKHGFKEVLAEQHYKMLLQHSRELDALFGDTYDKAKKELGSEWVDLQWYDAVDFDRMGSIVCDVLLFNEDDLSFLTDAQRERIKQLAELDCTNFADKLCEKLGIAFTVCTDEIKKAKAMELFFNPAIDQHTVNLFEA